MVGVGGGRRESFDQTDLDKKTSSKVGQKAAVKALLKPSSLIGLILDTRRKTPG